MYITPGMIKEQRHEKEQCHKRVAIFLREWPDGVEVSLEAAERAVELGLDPGWAAKHLLPAPAWKAYKKIMAPAWKAYKKIITPLLEAYERILPSTYKTHEEAVLTAQIAYKKALTAAEVIHQANPRKWVSYDYEAAKVHELMVYDRAVAAAMEIYRETVGPALAAYDAARAEMFKMRKRVTVVAFMMAYADGGH